MVNKVLFVNDVLIPFIKYQSDVISGNKKYISQYEKIEKNTSEHFELLCSEFITNISVLQKKSEEPYSCLINKFPCFADVLKLDKEQNEKDGHNFSIFELLRLCGLRFSEPNHSRIIKFLLEPNELHGQGNLFLYLFLKKLGIQVSDNIEKENWNVVAEQGRIDILLQRGCPLSVIIIENKSNWAEDQPNQLYRYWYNAIYSKTNQVEESYYKEMKSYYRIVYLVPNENKNPSLQTLMRPDDWADDLPLFVPLKVDVYTFSSFIFEWLEDCKQALSKENHALKEFLKQYQIECRML